MTINVTCYSWAPSSSDHHPLSWHVIAQASSGNLIVILVFIRLLVWKFESSHPGARRTILLLSSSENIVNIIFSYVLISKTVSNTSVQHALWQCSSTPRSRTGTGPRNSKRILVVTQLTFWACDLSIPPMKILLRKYTQATVKLLRIDWSAVKKGLGNTALVHIFQTLIRNKRLFGTPTAFSVMRTFEKWNLSFGPASNFL